jgi:hypothetical protein
MRKKNAIFSFLLGTVLIAFMAIFGNLYFSRLTIDLDFPIDESVKSTAPPPTMPATSLGVVEEIVSNLEWGNIAFDTPKKMKFEEPKTIELLLSPTKSVQELQSSLKSHEQTESARIQISNRMKAGLSGLGFKIETSIPQEQAVDRGKTTQWKWEVTPTKDGDQNLSLTLSAIIIVSNQKVPLVIRTFDKTIEVEVSVGQRISIFVAGNWQWLWASILVPLSPFLWKWYQKKRGKKQPPNNPGAAD